MTTPTALPWIAAAALLLVPSVAHAGPPLMCHPFQVTGAAVLPWGGGAGWNSPAPDYDRSHLVADTLRLLDQNTPVLDRMETMRRAVIYATQDRAAAERLLTAVQARAASPGASRLAVFDAGYLIETMKQATHLFGRPVTHADGYAMVTRAMVMGPEVPEMEFAAALMSEGARYTAHMERARRAMASDSLLARNIRSIAW